MAENEKTAAEAWHDLIVDPKTDTSSPAFRRVLAVDALTFFKLGFEAGRKTDG